jgi:cullin 1
VNTLENYLRGDALRYINDHKFEFLQAFVKVWDNYTMFAKLLEKMFDYLNRYFLKNQSMSSLGATAMRKFNELLYPEVKRTLREKLFENITKDRNREAVPREVLKRVIQCYLDMGLAGAKTMKVDGGFVWQGDRKLDNYDAEFEQHFLTYSREEFEKKANLWIGTLNCPEYLSEVDKALTKEEENAAYWLQQETHSKLF